MNKILLPYNKTILKINLIFSTILSIISALIIKSTSNLVGIKDKEPQLTLHTFLWYYIIWLITGGFFLSAYYFEIARKNEYYFYYNLGLSKTRLILFTYTLHIIIILPLLYILQYV